MPYVNKLDHQIGDWNLTPVRKKMSIARYGDDFKGCHGKATLIPEIGVYSCTCGKSFEPTDGMQIKGTKLSLDKWAEAMALARKFGRGTSPKAVSEHIGVSLVTAYRMLSRINALDEFDLGMDHKRPERDAAAEAKHRQRISNGDYWYRGRKQGGLEALFMLSMELDKLNPELPGLSKDYLAGLKHGLKWAAKAARKRAGIPEVNNPER